MRMIAVGILSTVVCSFAAAQTPNTAEPRTISLGVVSAVHQKEVQEHFGDFVRYVARNLSSASDVEGKVVVTPTLDQLVELLEKKQVDFYMESPYPTYVINDVRGAAELLLRRWKGGMAEYQSLIFARKDSALSGLEDLRGKLIVFEDPGSTSGHYLPKFFLLRKGFELSKKSLPKASVGPDEIGYVFAFTQDTLVDLVLSGKVSAGGFSTDDYAALDADRKADIKILAETGKLPRHLVSVRKDLDPELTDRLEKVLLTMHQDAEGQKILQNTDGTTKFDALPGGESQVRQQLLDNFYIAVRD